MLKARVGLACRLLMLCCALAGAGCVSLRADVERHPSVSFTDPAQTALGRGFAAAQAAHPGLSAATLLRDGRTELIARAALADAAERSIDVQYYIYRADQTGLVLLDRLVAAAQRGVRVRILLDDNNLGAADVDLAVMNRLPNLEIRIFNAFKWRDRWSRLLQFASDFDRLNRRMHNKLFAVDGEVAILGGRNIGNEYFDAADSANFSDFGVVVAGPAVRAAGRSFDAYWNSALAVPATALSHKRHTDADLDVLVQRLQEYAQAFEQRGVAYPVERSEFLAALLANQGDAAWSRVYFIGDLPGKIDNDDTANSPVQTNIGGLIDSSSKELLMESAYLVPGRRLRHSLSATARRGSAVSVLTNSLAATDVPAVHAGYARHRVELLRAGIRLYEFRLTAREPGTRGRRFAALRFRPSRPPRRPSTGPASGAAGSRPGIGGSDSSKASLHSKVLVVDSRELWIGSFNMDQRSARLNTENGVLIENPQIAGELRARVFEDLGPERAWVVEFTPACAPPAPRAKPRCRHLQWRGEQDGREVVLDREPETTLGRRIAVKLLQLIPGLDRLL
jgi:putative cardiolipin synthase